MYPGGPSFLNILDIFLIGLAIYFFIKFIKSPEKNDSSSPLSTQEVEELWARLRSTPATTPTSALSREEEFLKGAKLAYLKISESLSRQDWNLLQDLLTPELFNQLYAQLSKYPPSSPPKILKLEASVKEIRNIGEKEVATVLFQVLLQENTDPHPKTQEELWKFSRHSKIANSTWKLMELEVLAN
ncbi:MAG: hypothetical protein PWR24_1616 [Desulfonauticus sp.]|nr:hypothetical protein [Desulfonauticus sp.]